MGRSISHFLLESFWFNSVEAEEECDHFTDKSDKINKMLTIIDYYFHLIIFSKNDMKFDHINLLITLTSGYIKWLSM